MVHELTTTGGEDIGVAYMYCDYADRDNQTAENIIATLVKQLSLQKPSSLGYIWKLYEQCNRGKIRPDATRLTETMKNICTGYRQIYVVIDALDECDEKSRKSILAQFDKVDHSVARFFLTSRPHLTEMQRKFSELPQVKIKAEASDIREFILNNIRENDILSELIENTMDLEDEIITTIIGKAGEMSVILITTINVIDC